MDQGIGFPDRVTLYDDGAYRWSYSIRAHGNNASMRFMLGICAAVFLPIAVIMLVMTWSYGALQAVLYAAGLTAAGILLPLLVWKLLPPDPAFRMTEEFIEAWPKGRGNNIHHYKGVQRVTLRPDIDRIGLRWRFGALHVYVPPEDYDFVKEFVLAHVPEDAERR